MADLTVCAHILTGACGEDMPGVTNLKALPYPEGFRDIQKWLTSPAQPGCKPTPFTAGVPVSPGTTLSLQREASKVCLFLTWISGLSCSPKKCFDRLRWLRISAAGLNGAGLASLTLVHRTLLWIEGKGTASNLKIMKSIIVIVQWRGLWNRTYIYTFDF